MRAEPPLVSLVDESKKCVTCGALNQESDSNCGVCGNSLTSLLTRPQTTAATGRRVQRRGLAGLSIGLALVISGFLLFPSQAGPLGFFLLFFGLASIGTAMGMFKGLPYQPNPGGHRGGDPDLVATATRGAIPSHTQMLEVDRKLDSIEKRDESD